MSKKYPSHEYADLFPMMTALELEALADDVRANGLRHPVVLYGGRVLDGRNRLLACERAGVEPRFEEFDGDDVGALALVISLNVQRRDLTAAQRAISAARALPMLEAARAKNRGGDRRGKDQPARSVQVGNSRDDASKIFKVGVNAVQQAKAVLQDAPDLAQQVENCTTSLVSAYETVQQRRREARQRERDAERVAEYREAVSSGEITLDAALQKAIEEERSKREAAARDAEARKLFFDRLGGVLSTLAEWVGKRTDDDLAWYTEPGASGAETTITSQQIGEAAEHLRRVLRIAFTK